MLPPTGRRLSTPVRLRLVSLLLVFSLTLLALPSQFALILPTASAAPSPNIVISQIYGAGGNSGATFTHDYIEIFNRGNAPVALNGWSLQYASATGTGNFGANSGQLTELPSVTLNPGQYFLVQEGGGTVGAPLPAPDFVDPTPIAMAAGAGKVALVNTTTSLGCNGGSNACSAAALAAIVDLVGYGNANFFEGAGTAPAPSATNAIFRDDAGCVDTDQNTADFTGGAPAASPGPAAPRNTASPLRNCGVTPQPTLSVSSPVVSEGNAGTTNVTVTVSLSSAAGASGVSYTLASEDGSATVADGDYAPFGPVADTIPTGSSSKSYTLTVNGDTTFEPNESFLVKATGVTGAANTSAQGTVTVNNDDVTVTPIYAIQGGGAASPFDGQAVHTTGVVTARKTNGFFLQDAVGDGNDATSDAVFVFTSSAPNSVAVGDFVQVGGRVDEFRSATSSEPSTPADPETLTEIVGPLTISVLSSGNPLPAPVDATALGVFSPNHPSRGAQLERYEAMRMSVAAITVSQATNNFAEFWGVEPPRPRPFREPGIEAGDPVPAADDGPYAGAPPPAPPTFDGNFERVMVDSDDATTAAGARRAAVNVTTGTLVSGIVGPLDYAFDNFRIVLEAGATPSASGGVAAATPVPARTAQEFTIGHANLENFGLSNGAAFAGRLNKASLAVRTVLGTPDILGVIEVFDLPSLQALAAKINADANDPGVNYQAYLAESAATFANSQDVGYLVNAARVTVVGTPYQYNRTKTFTYNGETDLLHDRPAYVLTADVPSGGASVRVTVVVNHTKSLIEVDSQAPRGVGGTEGARNREKRRQQAEDIADLIESLQNENLVVLGDLNAFDFNDGLVDVVGTLKGSPAPAEEVVEPSADRWSFELTNLLSTLPASERYSYVFEGNAQVLDHVLVNDRMLARNTRFAYARNNVDFSDSFAADTTRPEALSDHDAPVAYFTVPNADLSVTKSAAAATVLSGADATYTVTVANNSADDAAGVTMTESIPAGTTLASFDAPAGWDCAAAGGSLTCTAASLAGNSSAAITVVLTVDCATADGATVTNTASVTTSTPDYNPSNNSDSESVTVSNPAPVIAGASVDKPVLSPPNHQMVDVAVSYTVADNCGTPAVTLSVTSDEPVNGAGDGNTAPDWEVVDANRVRLRAERSGTGDGRVYTITITATDAAGNSSSQAVTVSVPKGNKK